MKKIHLVLFLILTSSLLFAQSTTITPGSVVPSKTTAARVATSTLIDGLLVFDTDLQTYWYVKNGSWTEISSGSSTSHWTLAGTVGNELKNTNAGGFWSERATTLSTSPAVTSELPISGIGTRFMWIPDYSALRAGTINIASKWSKENVGMFSTALGYNTMAKGKYSTALGDNTTASGDYSTALGRNTTASGDYSTALGHQTTASSFNTTALGYNTKAIGNGSTALGDNTTASGGFSTALGHNTTASGSYSTAMGNYTFASGFLSTALGYNTKAIGDYSTALGYQTTASGNYSTALGHNTTASGDYSTAVGTRISTKGFSGSMVLGDYVVSSGDSLKADAENRLLARFDNGYKFYTNNDLSGTSIGIMALHNASSWSSISDSTKKENFIPSNGECVLNSVAQMRIGTWNYKGQDPSLYRHWGVMAQDFYEHFGKDSYGTVGSDTMISTADFDGVSFAAIKALEERTKQLQTQIQKNKKVQAQLQTQIQKNASFEAELISMRKEYLVVREDLRVSSSEVENIKDDFKELKEMLMKSVAKGN